MKIRPTDKKKRATRFDKQDLCLRLVFQDTCSEVAISLHFSLKLDLTKRYINNRQQQKQRLRQI